MSQVYDNDLFEAFANASDNIYVYVTDVETDVTRWSRRAVDYFDLGSEYLRGVKDMWPQFIHPEDRQIYLDDISAVFDGRSANHNCQYRVRNRHGEFVWVECRGSIIYDNSGMPKVFAGIMTRLDNPNKYDSLTHLLSGYEFFRHPIAEAGTLMLVGVDRLRVINSQHGVLFGNRVILYLAEALAQYARGAVLFRYWGDDFLVYGPGILPQQMMTIFRNVYRLCSIAEKDGGPVNFTVSAGIVSCERNAPHAELVSRAEMTLTYAKEQSAAHVAVYSPELETLQSRKNRISEALIRSIRDDFRGFSLVFQPIMSGQGERMVGCEALLRWAPGDERIGACYPNEFIPILEENGGIREVGRYVMREAIRHAAAWQTAYPGLRLSFNVSYLQLEDPDFVPSIAAEIKWYHIDPACIVVELTESVFASDTVLVKQAFEYLKQHGIGIALDDFGRGNSSFWMLHQFPVDYVKLDQAFVRGLTDSGSGIDDAIVQSTVLLCRAIGSRAVAEGVETPELRSRICGFGFDGLQGYLFSRPVPVEALEAFLAAHWRARS